MHKCMSLAPVTVLVLALLGCSGNGVPSGGDGGGGGGSNPIPTLSFIDPHAAATGGPDFYLSLYGSGFVPSSSLQWNGATVPTTFVSGTMLYAKVPAAQRSAQGSVAVTVSNPAPGGGTSAALMVTLNTPTLPASGIGVLRLVSATLSGAASNGNSFTNPTLTPDGRYVAFQSDATDIIAGGGSGFTEVFVRDTCVGSAGGCAPSTVRASVSVGGGPPNGNSRGSAINGDGRYVVFDSSATNLVSGVDNGHRQVYLRDTCIGAPGCTPKTTCLSIASDGTQGNDDSDLAVISADARFVAFSSVASNLAEGDSNGFLDIFVRDTCIGAPAGCVPSTKLISVTPSGSASNGPSAYPWISADGRYISYRTNATNLTATSSPVILRDTCSGGPSGCTAGNRGIFVGFAGDSVKGAVDNLWVLSSDGRFSGFGAQAQNLVPGDSGQTVGAFVYDSCIGAPASCVPHTTKASQTYDGGAADSGSSSAVVSDDGNYVVFTSVSSNLLPYAYISKAVYVRRTCAADVTGCVPTTYLLSLDSSTGVQGNSSNSDFPAITPDGRYAVFISNAANWTGSLQSNGMNQVWLARVH